MQNAWPDCTKELQMPNTSHQNPARFAFQKASRAESRTIHWSAGLFCKQNNEVYNFS